MADKEDYTKILDRARKRRNNNDNKRYSMMALVLAGAIIVGILIGFAIRKGIS